VHQCWLAALAHKCWFLVLRRIFSILPFTQRHEQLSCTVVSRNWWLRKLWAKEYLRILTNMQKSTNRNPSTLWHKCKECGCCYTNILLLSNNIEKNRSCEYIFSIHCFSQKLVAFGICEAVTGLPRRFVFQVIFQMKSSIQDKKQHILKNCWFSALRWAQPVADKHNSLKLGESIIEIPKMISEVPEARLNNKIICKPTTLRNRSPQQVHAVSCRWPRPEKQSARVETDRSVNLSINLHYVSQSTVKSLSHLGKNQR